MFDREIFERRDQREEEKDMAAKEEAMKLPPTKYITRFTPDLDSPEINPVAWSDLSADEKENFERCTAPPEKLD